MTVRPFRVTGGFPPVVPGFPVHHRSICCPGACFNGYQWIPEYCPFKSPNRVLHFDPGTGKLVAVEYSCGDDDYGWCGMTDCDRFKEYALLVEARINL